MGIVIEQENFETLPMGEYPARIVDVNETVGQYGRQIVFSFAIDGGAFDGRMLKGWTSATFGRKSKLYSWTRAAFGQEIPEDYDLDTDHLLGRTVRLGIIVRLKAETGEEFNKIDGVLPVKRVGVSGPSSGASADTDGAHLAEKWAPPAAFDFDNEFDPRVF